MHLHFENTGRLHAAFAAALFCLTEAPSCFKTISVTFPEQFTKPSWVADVSEYFSSTTVSKFVKENPKLLKTQKEVPHKKQRKNPSTLKKNRKSEDKKRKASSLSDEEPLSKKKRKKEAPKKKNRDD